MRWLEIFNIKCFCSWYSNLYSTRLVQYISLINQDQCCQFEMNFILQRFLVMCWHCSTIIDVWELARVSNLKSKRKKSLCGSTRVFSDIKMNFIKFRTTKETRSVLRLYYIVTALFLFFSVCHNFRQLNFAEIHQLRVTPWLPW